MKEGETERWNGKNKRGKGGKKAEKKIKEELTEERRENKIKDKEEKRKK